MESYHKILVPVAEREGTEEPKHAEALPETGCAVLTIVSVAESLELSQPVKVSTEDT